MTTEIGEKETTAEERLRDRLGDRSDEKNDEEKVEELFAASQEANCDRRKRKSTDESPEVALKRTKYEGGESEEGDSPNSGSSSSSSTSGVDLAYATEELEEESTKSSSDSVIKCLNDFKVFAYDECARSKNSAIKGAENACEAKKKKKARPARSIKFTVVREFKFPRAQSFVTMPTNGGYSLGMEKRHMSGREVSLDRYRIERERSRRRKYRRWYQNRQLDVENDNSDSDSENENEESMAPNSGFCLMPVPLERRKQLLASSSSELSEQQRLENEQQFAEINLRSSRENCGCNCQNICYPESCECHINGIGCQVDRQYFPCGCLPKNCYNKFGRTSFNVDRVRAHLQRTLHRVNSGIPFEESPSNPNEQNSNEQQSFSFGDYTLPCGNPPPVNNFGNGLWNQCYSWSDYTAYDYSYNSGSSYHQMTPHQPSSTGIEQYNVNPVLSAQNEPSEQLSESSESAFGDDNMVSPQPPQTDESGFQAPSTGPLGLETSIQLPYQEDSNHSVPLSVGSE